jgi:nucleotide-binding universal stress UspA family protein
MELSSPSTATNALADKEQPHLIAMGSRGQGAFACLVPGSVAAGVPARCGTPVLLIR